MRERVDEPVEVPVDELKGLRPPVDRVRMEATRARAEQSLFGAAAPARLGRYVLLGQSADGGMGIVHAAYDPELHRKVALKVLHPRRQADSRAQDRMIAEARALARLDHPNVVKVHDVITDDDQVVIIMEWIDGATLAAWERDRPRSWREIVTVYAQAGQGLAAAHGVGVVHRDFKPGNAIIGHDGRVRVLDFGLARSSGPAAGRALPAALLPGGIDHEETWSTSLTGTGDVVGTLAYAAPEQIAGRGVTAASDQFSFGVALHRALEGVPPFAGADAAALSRSIAAQRIACATDARAVPAWLRAIIARALAADPAARFPSLAALLAELTRPRGLRRWRVPLVVGASLAVAALALAMRPGASEPLASCDGGIAEAAAVWSAGPRVRVRAALAAIATPYVRQIEDRVVRGLDGYRDRWVALHRDACVAHRRGEQSEALLDRRMLCLQRHLGDLRATVSVLAQLDATSAANATDLVARMPDLAECADAERLQADTAPPASLTQRLAVDAARREISHAAALDRAGRSAEAIAAATAATGIAEQSGYPPVVADAVLTHGRILLATEDYERAAASFRRARAIALAQRELSVAVEAAARALYAEGMANADARAAERDAAVLVPLAEGLIGDHVARPLLLNNLGAVYMAAGDRGQATRYFQEAHRALAGPAAPDLELTIIDRNLAMVTADAGQRVALARGVWLRLQAALGDANLRTVSALVAYARYTPEASEAAALLASACRTLDEMHPELIGERIYCESYRAFLTEELGEDLTARRIHDRIVELGAGSTDAEARWRAAQASCHAQLLRGAPEAAIIELTPWASVYSNSPRWWLRVRAADTALCLGEAKHLLGRNRDAARDLGLAKEIYAHVIQLNEEVEFRRKLALADRLLGAVQRSIVRAHGIDASPAETVSRVPKQIRERTVTGIH